MTSARGAVGDAWQAVEGPGIGRDNDSLPRRCGRRDHEVVRAPRLPGSADVGEQAAVPSSDRDVVVLDRDRVDDRVHQLPSRSPALPVGELNAHEKLGDRDRRDGDVVIVGDYAVERRALSLCVDKDGRVEDQAGQDRSSTVSASRMSESSRSQALSGLCSARSFFKAFPSTEATGSSLATACPPRTTTKDWRRCSTASSISEKPRAASVAEISFTQSDYQSVLNLASRKAVGTR